MVPKVFEPMKVYCNLTLNRIGKLLRKPDNEDLIVVQEWQCHVTSQSCGSKDWLSLWPKEESFWKKPDFAVHQRGVVQEE